MSNAAALLFMLIGYVVCFLAGKICGEGEMLKKMKSVLGKAKADAIRADSHMLEESEVHRPSYDIGYFQGEIETIDIVLDLFDKKKKGVGK